MQNLFISEMDGFNTKPNVSVKQFERMFKLRVFVILATLFAHLSCAAIAATTSR